MRAAASLIAGLLLAFAASNTSAEVRTPAQVRYETRDGASDWHKTQVTFLKGAELNKTTRTFDYNAFSAYVVIFFAQDQAAVIELDAPVFGCGSEFTANCIPRFGNPKGKDQSGRTWEICTGSFCV